MGGGALRLQGIQDVNCSVCSNIIFAFQHMIKGTNLGYVFGLCHNLIVHQVKS